MAVTMYCPSLRCPAIVRVSENDRGSIVACEECGVHFKVPPRPRLIAASEANPVVEVATCSSADNGASEASIVEEKESDTMRPAMRKPIDFPLSRHRSFA